MVRRIVTVAGLLAVCAAALVLTASKSSDTAKGTTFKIAFDNAFGLTQGGDLRVGGVKAGKTTSFDISTGPACQDTPDKNPPRTCAIVTATVNKEGFQSFRTDAHCDIRQQSLIGEYYVDCQPGNAPTDLSDHPVAPGLPKGMIPATHTTSTIPADLVQDIMRRPYRDRFRLIISELGTGLAGRAQDIAVLLHKAHPGLRETDRVLRILGNQRTIIRNFISNSNIVVRQLDQRKADLQRWIVEASKTADVSASRRSAIAGGFQRLPRFLDELRSTMAQLAQFTDAQTPLLRDLHTAAPDLTTFLAKLGPFSQASRPAFRSLAATSDEGRRAFRNSAKDIAVLRQVAQNSPGAAKPLRQFLQTMDSKSRVTESNPEQAALAPPAPDPTAGAKGLTGMMAFWNYFFQQPLAINLFDSYSHVLRGVAITDPDCGPFRANLRPASMPFGSSKNDPIRKKCNSYLGPNQPGVTTPDFTPATYNAKNGRPTPAPGRTRAKYAGEVRGPGQPEAGPLPGQIDWSKPHPTLSPSQQELIQALSQGGGAPSSGGGGSAATEQQLLDYLLAP